MLRVVSAPPFGICLPKGTSLHTRVSARVPGLEEEAGAFFRCLAGLYRRESKSSEPRISDETFEFWCSALKQ